MLDKKWIKNNPEAFKEAMKNRGAKVDVVELLMLMELEEMDKQLVQMQNQLKNTSTELFLKLKKISSAFRSEEIDAMNAEVNDK